MNEDATAIKPGGLNQVIIQDASAVASRNVILQAEGAHIHKVNGKYYIFLITWPVGGGELRFVFAQIILPDLMKAELYWMIPV